MHYTTPKILAYVLAWTMPALLLYLPSRWMEKRSVAASTQRVVRVFLIPLAWFLGLVFFYLGQFFHESAWFMEHARGSQTEEDMMTLGDYPNATATWIVAGWIPVAIGLILARRPSSGA